MNSHPHKVKPLMKADQFISFDPIQEPIILNELKSLCNVSIIAVGRHGPIWCETLPFIVLRRSTVLDFDTALG